MRWPGCTYCHGRGCMHCPDARDEDLYRLVSEGRVRRDGGRRPEIVIMLTRSEYEEEAMKAQQRREAELRASLAPLFQAAEVSPALAHAREMRDAWARHRTSYAIEQHGFWSRRVEELEAPPKMEPRPRRKKKR